MSNGRPTAQQQLELQEELRVYYERGISATLAAKYSDTNVKTACKYFKQWSNEINGAESKEFKNRLVEMRSQHLIVLDRQLNELNHLSSSISYRRNFQDELNIIKMILDIMDRKEKLLQDIKNVPNILKKKSR